MRGYHAVLANESEKGELRRSFYYVPKKNMEAMHKYAVVTQPFFNREFPTSWRDLDKGVDNLPGMI